MDKFTKKKSLDESKMKSQQAKNRQIPQNLSLNETPSPIKSLSTSPPNSSGSTGSSPNKFKFSSLLDRKSARSSIESTHSEDTVDSHHSEISTTTSQSNTSTKTLFKGGSFLGTFRSSPNAHDTGNVNKQPRKSNFLSSSFSSSVSSSSSPPLSPNTTSLNALQRSKDTDSRRPTVEEIRKNLDSIRDDDDTSSDWSSIGSVMTAVNQAATSSAGAAMAAKTNPVKKPKRLEKPTTSWSSLNNLGYDEDDFMDAFRVFDTNGDGRITAKELNHVLKELGIKMTRNEIKKMIGELDKDGNGTIEYSEFVAMMTAPASRETDEFELREAFKCIDLDGNGYISRDELKDAVQKIMSTDSKVSLQDVEEMMCEADTDGNGLIDFDEFVRVLVEKRN